jgi:hypothetical protein
VDVQSGGATVLSSPTLQYYRLYCINRAGKITGVEETHCEDDESACAHARTLLPERNKCERIEIWNHARRVGHVERD